MLSDVRKIHPIYLGDRVTVQTIRGIKGNIIGRLPDGRAMLFERESPYLNMLGPGQLVECNVVHVSEKYVIVDPIGEPEPFKKGPYSGEPRPVEVLEYPEVSDDSLLEDLRVLSEKGEWETGIIAGALLYLIGRFDDFKEKRSEHSSLNTDSRVEEQPIETSTTSDEILSAAANFGLTKFHVREDEPPESEFLKYLEENQEERNDDLISTTIEEFGSIVALPKEVRILTMGQTRYLKEHHLKSIEGYDKIENLSNFFVEASALKNGEYGNVFYASRGTNPWNKVQRITVKRVKRLIMISKKELERKRA